jgi:hypothetical protein
MPSVFRDPLLHLLNLLVNELLHSRIYYLILGNKVGGMEFSENKLSPSSSLSSHPFGAAFTSTYSKSPLFLHSKLHLGFAAL